MAEGRRKRQANFELLRILAMCMIVAMHYLLKGGILLPLSENGSPVNHVAWLIEAFCIVAVNVYVLISGYFLVEAEWKASRLVSLVMQVFVYSVGIPAVCLALDIGTVREWGIYQWINAVLPLQTEHYWFATAYVLMYLFAPVLAAGVKKLSKRQLQVIIGLLLLFFSVGKSLSPVLLATDRYGYDFGWFLCLFLVAAYIRLYGIPVYEKKPWGIWIYFGSVLGIWGISSISGYLSRRGLPFAYYTDMPYCYNYFLTLIGSVALFYVFSYIRIPEGRVSSGICRIAGYTFGVYLLHENIAVRELWQGWLGAEAVHKSFYFLPYMIFAVFVIFLAGVMTDFVRDCLFQKIKRIGKK